MEIDNLIILIVDYLLNYFRSNFLFLIILFTIVILFSILYGNSKNLLCNIIGGFMTIVVTLTIGYMFEIILNNISIENLLYKLNNINNLAQLNNINIIDNFNFGNEKLKILDFLKNILTQGFILIIIINIIKPKFIFSKCVIQFNIPLILLWMFYYSSIYILSQKHNNLYPDILMLLKNNNYNFDLNNTIFNLIIISILIIIFKNNMMKKFIL